VGEKIWLFRGFGVFIQLPESHPLAAHTQHSVTDHYRIDGVFLSTEHFVDASRPLNGFLSSVGHPGHKQQKVPSSAVD
jgi:hypothetical protein